MTKVAGGVLGLAGLLAVATGGETQPAQTKVVTFRAAEISAYQEDTPVQFKTTIANLEKDSSEKDFTLRLFLRVLKVKVESSEAPVKVQHPGFMLASQSGLSWGQ